MTPRQLLLWLWAAGAVTLVLRAFREKWIPGDWRHQLSNTVIGWTAVLILGAIGAGIYGIFFYKDEPSKSSNDTKPPVVGSALPAVTIPLNSTPETSIEPRPSDAKREPAAPPPSAKARPKPDTATAAEETLVLALNCQMGPMPRRIPPEPEGLWGVSLFNVQFSPLARYFTLDAAGGEADMGQGKFAMSARCELSNFGDQVLRETVLFLKTSYLSLVKDGASTRSGPVVSQFRYPIHIPSVLPAQSGRFVFYIWNMAEFFADVGVESVAQTKSLAEDSDKRASVVMTGAKSLSFNAREPK